MKKAIIFTLIFMVSLFFYKDINANYVFDEPEVYTEIYDLADLPNVVTRPVATWGTADYFQSWYGGNPVIWFQDLELNSYKFELRPEFRTELLDAAKAAYIADTGITPAYFFVLAQPDFGDPYRLSWNMEYILNGITMSFKFQAFDEAQQPIEIFDFNYTIENSDHASGGWTKNGAFSVLNDYPSTSGVYEFIAPVGAVMEYSLDGYTFERVIDYDGTEKYNKFKVSIGTEEGTLFFSSIYYRQNKYDEEMTDELSVDLGEYNPSTFKLRYLSIDSISDIPVENLTTVSGLPETTGNVLGKEGSMGTVHFKVEGTNVLAIISYNNQVYYVKYSFAANTDMSIFSNTYENYYYTSLNEKFIMVNQGDTSIFTVENILEQPFIPFTIWNLNTNELKTVKKYNVYMYSKKEEANNIYAYFYVDNYIIDNLVSVTVSMRYKYVYLFNEGDWQYYYKTLDADETNYGGGTGWQLEMLTGTMFSAFSGLMGGLTAKYRIAFFGSVLLRNVENKNFNFGQISEIEDITPSVELIQELNMAYSSKYPNFNGLNTDLGVFKLHLGQFNKIFSTGIRIDETFNYIGNQEGINVIEFTYITNTTVYTVKGEDINLVFVPGEGTNETPPLDLDIPTAWDKFIDFLKKAYILVVGVVWAYTLKYVYEPVQAITGKKIIGLSRLVVAAGWFAAVYGIIIWWMDFSSK